jgi:hypothetical protein
MAKHDLDLWLVLTEPFEARRFIYKFDWRQPYTPGRIELDTGRIVDLENLSDNDAVVVALFLLRAYQVPRDMAEKSLLPYEH